MPREEWVDALRVRPWWWLADAVSVLGSAVRVRGVVVGRGRSPRPT